MGCTSAKRPAQDAVAAGRRRLSLGEVGQPPEDATDVDSVEEGRSMLLALNQQQVLDLIRGVEKTRRLSIGTVTDTEMHRVASFKEKTVQLIGEQLNVGQDGIGYACKKGKKPESPNQDSFCIMRVQGSCSIYAVFDGHGHKGHDISNFIKEHLPKVLLQQKCLEQDPLAALSITFETMQQLIVQATRLRMLDATQSGSTASVIYHDHRQNTLHIAHVGDSRCVLGKYNPEAAEHDRWTALDLTVDHKPNAPEERRRIEAAGGRVVYDGGWNYRVYARNHRGPGLNMSRAMGDLVGFYHAGISASPDVQTHSVKGNNVEDPLDFTKQGTQDNEVRVMSSSASVASYRLGPGDKFVLLCSDGVWEFISSLEAVRSVAEIEAKDAMKAAENLTALAWDRWMEELQGQVVDDITVILVNLEKK